MNENKKMLLQNKKRKMNKRGQELIVDFWTIIGFMFIMLIIFIIFWVSRESHSENVAAEFAGRDADAMLISFLNSRLDYQNKDQTIAEIIGQDVTAFDDMPQTRKIFSYYFAGVKTYRGKNIEYICLKVYYDDRDLGALRCDVKKNCITEYRSSSLLDSFDDCYYAKTGNPVVGKDYSETYIPLRQGGEIKVELVVKLD